MSRALLSFSREPARPVERTKMKRPDEVDEDDETKRCPYEHFGRW